MLVLSVDLDSCNLVAVQLELNKKKNNPKANKQTKKSPKPQNSVGHSKMNPTCR